MGAKTVVHLHHVATALHTEGETVGVTDAVVDDLVDDTTITAIAKDLTMNITAGAIAKTIATNKIPVVDVIHSNRNRKKRLFHVSFIALYVY